MPTRSIALGALLVAAFSSAVLGADEPLLESPVRLTSPAEFSRAGEAYFSPDGEWIAFQAVPAGQDPGGSSPRYLMYVAPLERDADGAVTGLGEPVLISHEGSANTCAWFHPSMPGVLMFGSTLDRPSPGEQEAGFQRESSRYAWAFPREMDIVTRTVPEVVDSHVTDPALRRALLARPDVAEPVPFWESDGYDAECSWSPDGRFVLFTAVDPETGDADIHVREIATGDVHPLVVAPGYDGGPFFSPDGTRICYRSDREGNNLLQVFVSDLEFDHRGVPVGVARETQLTENDHVNWAPYFHPSGEFLIYTTSQISHMNYEVFALPAYRREGEAPKASIRVTNASGFDGLPVFDVPGQHMMWTSQRPLADGSEGGSSQLWIARVSDALPASFGSASARASTGAAPSATEAPVADAFARLSPLARSYNDHVTILASPWLAGRLPGTRGIERAEEYIAENLAAAGLEPAFSEGEGSEGSFFQPFELRPHASDTKLNVRNVGAILPGRGTLADRWVIIGAHHDHLGKGEYGSMVGPGQIHEGADDNASGTSAVLCLAQQLRAAYDEAPQDADLRSVLFVTFTSEEMGINGSRHFAQNPPIDLDSCDLMLNYDMIGRITEGRVSVSGLDSGEGLENVLDGVLSAGPLEVVRPDGLSARSDHAPFYDERVPVLFMSITPFHADYHTPDDESWKINRHGAALAVELSRDMVLAVSQHASPIAFSEVENYDQGPSVRMGNIKVRFGIMPGNYNDSDPGVQVQRVSPNTSAELSGVLAGDRLMMWDGVLIETIPMWMELMSKHAPGDVVRVEVDRDGERVELLVTLLPSRSAESTPDPNVSHGHGDPQD